MDNADQSHADKTKFSMELNVSVLQDLDVLMESVNFNQLSVHQTHSIMVLNVYVYQDSLK